MPPVCDVHHTHGMGDRQLPVGAERVAGGVSFRVWAPAASRVQVVLESGPGSPAAVVLDREDDGYFSTLVEGAAPGTRYRFRLGDGERALPDPASRFQPDGPHGPSEVVDASTFAWTDDGWGGVSLAGQVFYELHVGTFTREGTWAAAAEQLPELARLGITVIELMPVAEFAGRFGWGYDGVDPFAPTRLYGRPDDLRRFVDRAHGLGIGVLLDVVYNHLGPDGNYLSAFAREYFTDRYDNEWGDALNFDGPGSGPVREFVTANAAYWIDEFHLDGLRIDATQQMFDASPEHVLAAIARRVREAGGRRSTLVIAENEPQQTRLVRPPDGTGYGLDAVWSDDFHHAARVAVTGRREAYYSDYRGTPQELVSAVKRGYLYQGQRSTWQSKRRGSSTSGLAPARFVAYLQNHDQVANSARGARMRELTSPARLRAITALLLLSPLTPMLFQGQEFGASAPFLYFADHKPELARRVWRGRAEFLRQFPSIATPEVRERLADPADPETWAACVLDFSERERHAEIYALHADLLRMRREDPVLAAQGTHGVDGAVLGPDAFVIRLFGPENDDRLLLVNLGDELALAPAPEPLLAPPERGGWEVVWSSEHPRYGGNGWAALDDDERWKLAAHAACLARPVEERRDG
jgi:maltooligosyltrehalose trehalohydrolase